MSINTPISSEKQEPKTDPKKGQSRIDKVKDETKNKVHEVLKKLRSCRQAIC